MLILISGKQGSGKTTLAKALEDHFSKEGYQTIRTRFAEPLYKMHDRVREVLKEYNYDTYDYNVKDGPLLQLLGTEWGRSLDKNIWVNLLRGNYEATKKKIKDSKKDPDATLVYIVEDCRFRNELDLFPDAISIRLECEDHIRKERCEMWRNNTAHPSEIDLDDYSVMGKFDITINSGMVPADRVLKLAIHRIKDPELYREKYGIRKIHEGIGLEPEPEIFSGGAEDGLEEEMQRAPSRYASRP